MDQTIGYSEKLEFLKQRDDLILTIFDGFYQPQIIKLSDFKKDCITFGRGSENDIVLFSPLVSREHGHFIFHQNEWVIEDKAIYDSKGSTNGLIYNETSILTKIVADGDFIRIDDGIETIEEGVLFVFSAEESQNEWNSVVLSTQKEITIGRAQDCNIILPHISISNYHGKIVREGEKYYLIDTGSTNGIIINNKRISEKEQLHEKDVISITNAKIIFTSRKIFYCCYKTGISVDTFHVVIRRGKGKKSFITSDNVSVNIKSGQLVAIIGGSGAGKSTILNCMCGYLPPSQGAVYINGINLYHNFDSLKKLIGYVPQSDIVYDNLTLYDMLSYTARLRLPKDSTVKEREEAIEKAIRLVDLTEKKDSFIKSLSGGQKKRASIAVELLPDPNLLFLDEPASGLDPGTERSLMQSLREMADNGKTIILVTHSTLQLQICDKIMFMGKGGKLCFFGSYNEALKFFGVSDLIDVYSMLTDEAEIWREKYEKNRNLTAKCQKSEKKVTSRIRKKGIQFPVLCSRYLRLIVNDRQRLLLLLIQAPALALLISFVADGQQFEQYEMTKSLLFALSCSAFWVGMLNAIQEICKERNIMKREYMTGLSLTAYILSKIFVLGILCLIQSVCIITVFAFLVGLPESGLLINPYLELLITTFITALASTAMGLFVSSLFTNADRAMTVAPILLMPQILFSGLIFKLDGATEMLSWFAVCRWSMEGYGTTANLNQLQLKLQQQGVVIPHETESFFDFTVQHMLSAWGILFIFVLIFLIMARIVISTVNIEKA